MPEKVNQSRLSPEFLHAELEGMRNGAMKKLFDGYLDQIAGGHSNADVRNLGHIAAYMVAADIQYGATMNQAIIMDGVRKNLVALNNNVEKAIKELAEIKEAIHNKMI